MILAQGPLQSEPRFAIREVTSLGIVAAEARAEMAAAQARRTENTMLRFCNQYKAQYDVCLVVLFDQRKQYMDTPI